MPDMAIKDNCTTDDNQAASIRSGRFVPSLLGGVSMATIVAVSLTAPINAQDAAVAGELEEIVVTGIRQSLRESADIKRNARGVVDGVVAEDIGKFPDSNIAESLQRITGVSINRQAGEGSQVTVRGLGAGFNQVQLNGRTMPTADIPVVGGDGQGLLGQAGDRAFDFSNLASESVRALQVYKSGRADIASGGVGATINVETRKPLQQEGLTGTISAKSVHDTSVGDQGSTVTPDITGFVSWSDEDQKIGLSLFGNYSRRDQAAGGIRVAGWDILRADAWANTVGTTPDANITGLPSDGSRLTATARDSRYQYAEITRERINGQAVLQFNPTDSLRFTADVLYAQTEASENRSDLSNWFDRPFDAATFDDSPVATAVFLSENKGAGVKDFALQQTHAATKDKLESYGFNVEWDANESLTFKLDAHSSKASVVPNARTGFAETNVGIAMPVVRSHSVDYSTGTPVINVTRDDSIISNGDGVFDINDVSTQISNDDRDIRQVNKVDQIDLRADWALDDDTNITVGANWRKQENETFEATYRQSQGGWGASNPGDVERLAPGALELFNWDDAFNDFQITPGLVGVRGNALDIWEAIEPHYTNLGNAVSLLQQNHDITEEETLSVYAQIDTAFELADRPVRFSAGLRYEQTDVTSFSQSAPTTSIIWDGDNDFIRVAGAGQDGFSIEGTYNNFLPNLDLSIDLTDELLARFSYGKTLARANFGSLKASTSISSPVGPSALGNPVTATRGNPNLLPLVSENFDISFEWYYGDDDWVSIGAFHKDVKNFVGNVTGLQPLFGIRDASAATAPRVVAATAALQGIGQQVTNTTLYAMTQLIDVSASVAEATATYQANVVDGVLDPAYAKSLEDNFDVLATSADPLQQFNVTSPQNIQQASIRGLELAVQHFFGDTGFGVAASYTLVDSDLNFDVTADPTAAQFALVGLSDTANVTLIYERDRWSARAAYNWRDEFLSNANRGDSFNNPTFTEAFASIDFNVSYDVTDDITVSLEAINVTGENSRDFNRATNQLWYMRENAPRYTLGAPYKF